MERFSYAVGFSPQVIIESVHGALQIKGWVRPEIFIKTSHPETLQVEEIEDGLRFSTHGDCIVRLPREAVIEIGKVHGSLRAKYLDRHVRVQQIDGSAGFRHIGSLEIESVRGDLLVQQALNKVRVSIVSGSAVVINAQGECFLQQVEGNLHLQEVCGNIHTNVNGHAHVRISLLCGEEYEISCGGLMHCQVPEDASLQVALVSKTQEIHTRQAGQNVVFETGSHSLTVGGGETRMKLTAGGKLMFECYEPGWDEIGELDEILDDEFNRFSDDLTQMMESKMKAQMDALNHKLQGLSENFSRLDFEPLDAGKLGGRVRQSSEHAAARAQEKMRRAQEKIERQLASLAARQPSTAESVRSDQSRVQATSASGWQKVFSRFGTKKSSPSVNKTAEPVADEERLLILRMLEQKKINSEEAEKLLEALENSTG